MAVKDYQLEAGLNVSISGINIAEGCPPSGINDAIRQLMADVKAESNARQQAEAQNQRTGCAHQHGRKQRPCTGFSVAHQKPPNSAISGSITAMAAMGQ